MTKFLQIFQSYRVKTLDSFLCIWNALNCSLPLVANDGFTWKSMNFHVVKTQHFSLTWTNMKIHAFCYEIPWTSMYFHGFSWPISTGRLASKWKKSHQPVGQENKTLCPSPPPPRSLMVHPLEKKTLKQNIYFKRPNSTVIRCQK